MMNYFFFVWLAMMFVIEETFHVSQKEVILGSQRIRLKYYFAVLAFFPLFIQSAFRGDIGDTYVYKLTYSELPDSLPALIRQLPYTAKDPGFTLFSGVIRVVFGPDPTIYLVVIALLQSLVLIQFFRRLSCNYLISLFLFYASTDFFSWMTNGIRQFLAVIIIISGTKYIIDKKWIYIISIVIFASTFHQSALIMLVLIPIAYGEAWNLKSLMFITLMLIAVLFVNQFTEILDLAMADTQYSAMVSDWTEWGDDGTSIFRVLVYSIPAIISLIGLKQIRYINDPLINLSTNMSIISSGIYLLSMFTSGIFIGRLPIYVSLFSYVLLPWEIRHLFNKESKKIVYILMIILYLIFFSIQVDLVWDI